MKIAIIGLGLIGGSMGLAIKQKTKHFVYGLDKSEAVIDKAVELGAIDQKLNIEKLGEMDVVCVAVFPKTAIKIISEISPSLKSGAIIFDIAGVKKEICQKMQELKNSFPGVNFISAHPMAGREVSGIESAKSTLFNDSYIIAVDCGASFESLSLFKELFIQIGARGVEQTTSAHHDKMISYTSQLAHIVSSSYIKNPLSSEHTGYSAGSFLDMTRVARLNPEMWTQLCLENNENLVEQISLLQTELEKFKNALSNSDKDMLYKLFEDGLSKKEISDKNYNARTKSGKNNS